MTINYTVTAAEPSSMSMGRGPTEMNYWYNEMKVECCVGSVEIEVK